MGEPDKVLQGPRPSTFSRRLRAIKSSWIFPPAIFEGLSLDYNTTAKLTKIVSEKVNGAAILKNIFYIILLNLGPYHQ